MVMYGSGGVIGSLIGGEITRSFDPHNAFYITSAFGFLISIVGCSLSMKLEESNEEIINMTLLQRSGTVFKEVWKGL